MPQAMPEVAGSLGKAKELRTEASSHLIVAYLPLTSGKLPSGKQT